jgi:hypothetical protein
MCRFVTIGLRSIRLDLRYRRTFDPTTLQSTPFKTRRGVQLFSHETNFRQFIFMPKWHGCGENVVLYNQNPGCGENHLGPVA